MPFPLLALIFLWQRERYAMLAASDCASLDERRKVDPAAEKEFKRVCARYIPRQRYPDTYIPPYQDQAHPDTYRATRKKP